MTDNPNLNKNFDQSNLWYYNRVFDGQDIVFPPKETNGFFLTTNLVITKNQSLGNCPDWASKECDPSKAPDQCMKTQSVLSDGENSSDNFLNFVISSFRVNLGVILSLTKTNLCVL